VQPFQTDPFFKFSTLAVWLSVRLRRKLWCSCRLPSLNNRQPHASTNIVRENVDKEEIKQTRSKMKIIEVWRENEPEMEYTSGFGKGLNSIQLIRLVLVDTSLARYILRILSG
jgi:hypothetical protein